MDLPTPKLFRTRIDYNAIQLHIKDTDFSPVLDAVSASTAAETLVNILSSIVAKHTSTKAISKKNQIIKPWITPGLLHCIRHRDNLHNDVHKDPKNDILLKTYTRYRNFANNLLNNIKQKFEMQEFENAKNNPKATWKVIKTITNCVKPKNQPTELLKLHPCPNKALNVLNDYFVNIGRNLAEKIPLLSSGSSLMQPMPINTRSGAQDTSNSSTPLKSMAILDVDQAEIEDIILNLRTDCAVGWDGIPALVLKQSIIVIAPLLTFITNLALHTGDFPAVFKKAIVHPIFKSGDRNSIGNYRPISVLPTPSKVLEKAINRRLVNYLEANNIIADNQYGFRKSKSTEDAVTSLVNTIVTNVDDKRKCLGIFIDLSKAFDTVSIPTLINKLEAIGIRGMALEIFKSYLSERKQLVKIDSHQSNDADITYGVPQGSILGPTLFLIYVNDLCKMTLSNATIISYADDTAILVQGHTWEDAVDHAEKAANDVMKWLSESSLTLNTDKTNYICFTFQSKGQPSHDSTNIKIHRCLNQISEHCDCQSLTRVKDVKYLGIHIDETLHWHLQTKTLTTRVRKLIYVFKLLRNSADIRTLKTAYSSLCQSLITYCNTAWGGAGKTIMLRLERSQRAVLKVMLKKPFLYPTKLLYKDCGLLTIRQLFILRTILRKHSQLPFDRELTATKRRHHHVCPSNFTNTNLAKQHFNNIAPHLYN